MSVFTKYILPTSELHSKPPIRARPQKEPVRKLSIRAAHAFVVSLRSGTISIDEGSFFAKCSNEPPVTLLKDHLRSMLKEQSDAAVEKVLAALNELAFIFPPADQIPVEVSPKTVFISDVPAFKNKIFSGYAKSAETPAIRANLLSVDNRKLTDER